MDHLSERVRNEGQYIVSTGCTVRTAAAVFKVGKSTIHKDMTERLSEIDAKLYAKVRAVLDKNLQERHIRGGNATREHYKKLRK